MASILDKHLNLNDEEKLIFETVREFCIKEITPQAKEVDQNGLFPQENIKKMNEIGLNGLFVPVEYGGNMVSKKCWFAVLKEIFKACGSTGIIFATNCHACHPITLFGNTKQKEAFLPMFAKGALGAICITEYNAGSDAKSMNASAKKINGGYLLNGTKAFISNGDVADILLVFAKVIDQENRLLGISPFVVLRKNAEGITIGKRE